MKIPKIIKITGVPLKILFNQDIEGADFNFNKKLIRIGKHNKEITQQEVLHEIFEALLTGLGHRYTTAYADCDYFFLFNHKEFSNLIYQIEDIIKQLE